MSASSLHIVPPADFPQLSRHGNYDADAPLPAGLARIERDGSIRLVRKLGIPFRDIVSVEYAYGNTYKPRVKGYAIPAHRLAELAAAIEAAKEKRRLKAPSPHPDLLLCISEASRAAHRNRDQAEEAYFHRRHALAGNAKRRKNAWYALKDRGIVHCHRQGLLRYVGASPQRLAVYEYERDGATRCFHSTLHPAGVERPPVENHPETLFVAAKAKMRGLSLQRVEITLQSLDDDTSGYERSDRPTRQKDVATCWTCGEAGHLARDCDAGAWIENAYFDQHGELPMDDEG